MENNNNTKKHIDTILEKIHKNELTIKPKTYFRLKLLALIFISVLTLVTSVLLFSFIAFSLRMSGDPSLVRFGYHGITAFLVLFPWKLFLFDIILLIILGGLLRSFRFGYKSPFLYLFAGVFLVMLIGGVLIDRGTPFHDNLLHRADRDELPFLHDLYEGVRRPPPPPLGHDIYRGWVVSIDDDTMIVNLDRPDATSTTQYKVIVPDHLSIFSEPINVGDCIFIAGKLQDGEIHAEHIRKACRIDEDR